MKVIVVSRSLSAVDGNEEIIRRLTTLFDDNYIFHLIFPEEAKYKVSEIKKLTLKLARKSTSVEKEDVYVLMNSDGMSAICQNALLKTLEDSNHSLVLAVKNVDTLLPTIKSRCITEYIEFEGGTTSSNEYTLNGYEDITSLAKVEREKVRTMLEQMVSQTLGHDLHKVVLIEDAIRKIDANCKIESVLYELVWKLQSSNSSLT